MMGFIIALAGLALVAACLGGVLGLAYGVEVERKGKLRLRVAPPPQEDDVA